MSRKMIGVLGLLVVSEGLGLFLGHWFFTLFVKTVPPLAVSTFSMSAARAAFFVYGAMSGLAIFGLSLLAAVLARFFLDPGLEG